MRWLLEQAAIYKDNQRTERLQRMKSLLSLAAGRNLQVHLHSPGSANIFTTLGVAWLEVSHSAMLAWLLDRNASHGQGSRFLEALLDCCDVALPADSFNRYVVTTEHTQLHARIDIAVYRPQVFVIYLENKVRAAEGWTQLNRELDDMRRIGQRLGVAAERQFALFLTPRGRTPVTGDSTVWHCISYQQIVVAFAPHVNTILSSKERGLVEDWLVTIGSF
jgi:PD-(D/E)XK nuclease superfamily protein